jgi:hypothetical protein
MAIKSNGVVPRHIGAIFNKAVTAKLTDRQLLERFACRTSEMAKPAFAALGARGMDQGCCAYFRQSCATNMRPKTPFRRSSWSYDELVSAIYEVVGRATGSLSHGRGALQPGGPDSRGGCLATGLAGRNS